VGRRGTTLGVEHREAGVAWGSVSARHRIGDGIGAAVLSSSYANAVVTSALRNRGLDFGGEGRAGEVCDRALDVVLHQVGVDRDRCGPGTGRSIGDQRKSNLSRPGPPRAQSLRPLRPPAASRRAAS